MNSCPLTTASRERLALLAQLAAHTEAAKKEDARLRAEIAARATVLSLNLAGIDHEKVALAKTVIYATEYSRGGTDRASCVNDAITQLSTGKSPCYHSLCSGYFGTKDYDRWNGQREDHTCGYGPRHGSMVFELGFRDDVRSRDPKTLTPEETEAAIYYLLNIERIQSAEAAAKAESKAA